MTPRISLPMRRRVAAAALGGLLLAACGGEDDTTTVADAPAVSDTAEESAAAPVRASLPTVNGGQFELGSIEGQDTVLWFWAPW